MWVTRLQEALLLASELHASQTRKGTTIPYLAHLLGVAATTMEHGGGEDEIIAALLHDAVEDQGGLPTLERIRSAFGDRVAYLVMGLTDAIVEPEPPWRARKAQYLAHLEKSDDSVRLVSMADKLYNAQSIVRDLRKNGTATLDRFTGGRDGTVWYYQALAAAHRKTSSRDSALLGELARVVEDLAQRAA